ncbi:MAG: helix-turn-helix transcriptional regulator [Lachnospiraceae bacterium]|nr:helix-turn-helix transcriptional regulator [Lachnospiraceae bacterium]
MISKKFADRLVILRGNLTQQEVAKSIGISLSTYSLYESGKAIPSDEKKKRIADYFHTTVQEIFFD